MVTTVTYLHPHDSNAADGSHSCVAAAATALEAVGFLPADLDLITGINSK